MVLLQVSGIDKEERGNRVLHAVSFSLDKGQRLGLMGETGSGKSTLLKIIGGWAQATKGEVRFKDNLVPGIDEKLVPGHPGIAYLSQQHSLPQHLRVEQILEYANKGEARRLSELSDVCRISHLRKRKTHELSGGEQQRVATALLLLAEPALLLLDEPFSNLDSGHKNLMKTIIAEAQQRLDLAIILASHDPLDILPWADDVLLLKQGRVVQHDSPETVYREPVNEYAAALLGSYNLLDAALLSLPTGSGKRAMVRPEGFEIRKANDPDAVRGIVQSVHFMGGFYEVLADLHGQSIRVHTTQSNSVKGDAIWLFLSPEAIWYV